MADKSSESLIDFLRVSLYVFSISLNEIKETARPICARHRVSSLRLFGSAARGEAGDDSDLDFCVSFEELPSAEYARQFFGLLHDLEDAFHSAVDLLTDSSVRKEFLRKSLQRDGVQICFFWPEDEPLDSRLMNSLANAASAAIGGPVLQLKISLKHVSPPIWRRVLVPAAIELEAFHTVIQAIQCPVKGLAVIKKRGDIFRKYGLTVD